MAGVVRGGASVTPATCRLLLVLATCVLALAAWVVIVRMQ